MKLNGMSITARWVVAIITICIFFGGIIISMAAIPTRDMQNDIGNHEVRLNVLAIQQAVIETKLDNISDVVKEIKEMLKK